MMSIHKSTLCAVCLMAVFCAGGCARSMLKPSGHYAYPKPLDGWDKQVVEKYGAEERSQYLKAELNKLPFLGEYNSKYPPEFRAWAVAAAEHDKAAKELNKIQADLAECATAKKLADKRLESLIKDKNDTTDFKERLQAMKDAIATLDKATAELEGDACFAKAEVHRTGANVEAGFRGLRALATAENKAHQKPGDGTAAQGASPDEHTYDVIAGFCEKADANGQLGDLAGFGLQYLDSMRTERNRILGELITVAEGYHKALDRKLFFSRAAGNMAFDGAIMGTTGIASVTGSEATSRALSAFATVLTGIQKSVDKELFFQQTSTALLHLMQADVDAKAAKLADGMAKGVEEYPLEVGLDDYVNFLLAGDLTSAIKLMDAAAAEKSREANATLEELKKAAQSRPGEIEKRRQEREAAKQQRLQLIIDQIKKLATPVGGAEAAAAAQ